jgi:hypothetical protein
MRFQLRYAFALPFALLSGCFGMCGPGGPSPDASCVDDSAPSGGGPAIVLGSSEEGDFEQLSGEPSLSLDYGSQGGQHFYYSIKAFGADTDAMVFVTFFRDGLDPIDGGGGAGGGGFGDGAGGAGGVVGEGGGSGGGIDGVGGGAASSTSSGSSGGGGESAEGARPSDLVFFSEYFEVGDCEGEWFQLDNLYLQVPSAVETMGLLRAQLGRCSPSGCPYDASGNYVPEEVLATAEARVRYAP